jgi:iron complex transport system substrate-binding protein
MRGSLRVLATLLLAAAATGCGLKSEPTGAQPGYPLTVVDGAGRTVTVDAQPRRVVSLDAGLTESLYAMGAGPQVVGRSGAELYPAAALQLPAQVSNGAPDLPSIQALHPDLVLAPPDTPAAQAAHMASQLRVPVYVPDQSTVGGIEHDMLAVAGLVGRTQQGRRLIDGMRSKIGRIERLAASRPRVSVFVDRGGRVTISPTGIGQLMIDLAGGLNAAANATPGTPVSLARLRQAPPRVYLAVKLPGAPTKQTLRRDHIHVGRFAVISRGLLADAGPRLPQALSTLAALLHPGLSTAAGG